MKLFNWRKNYWRKKIKGMKCMIEDEKFSRYKTLELREEVRQEYDQEQAKLEHFNKRIEDKDKTIKEIGKEEYEKLKDEKIRGEKRLQALKEEMDTLAQSVNGGKPTNEHPAGIIGNSQTIEKLYDLIDTVKSYLKNL